jgi:hypothetical protein
MFLIVTLNSAQIRHVTICNTSQIADMSVKLAAKNIITFGTVVIMTYKFRNMS